MMEFESRLHSSPFPTCSSPLSQSKSFHNEKKRKLDDNFMVQDSKENSYTPGGTARHCRRNFLEIRACHHSYQTEEWRPKGGHLYLPVLEDTLVNLRNIEKITIDSGNNFVADSAGGYSASKHGMVVNLWRYSEVERKLYISHSLLFTDEAVFAGIQKQLAEI